MVGDTAFVAGKVDQAFSFDGVGDYVEVPNDPSLRPGFSSFSIDFWLSTSSQAFQVFFNIGSTASGSGGVIRFDTGQGGSDKVRYVLGDGAGNIGVIGGNSADVNDGQFHHIALAVDGPNQLATLYVDGAEDSLRFFGGLGSIDPTGPLFFGGGLAAGDMLGELDEIEFFDRQLSESEVQAIYLAGSAGKCGGPPSCPPDFSLVPVDPPGTGRDRNGNGLVCEKDLGRRVLVIDDITGA
ncbi:MAG: LamG domain-containing protein [Dehalococcoidia bacterium]